MLSGIFLGIEETEVNKNENIPTLKKRSILKQFLCYYRGLSNMLILKHKSSLC